MTRGPAETPPPPPRPGDDASSDASAARRAERQAQLRRRLDRFIHHPYTDFAVVIVIITAVAALLGEAAMPRKSLERQILQMVGDACGLVWSVELAIRFYVAPNKRRFFARYWLDLLAVLPLARPLRLLRVLVLLRLFRAGMLMNRRLSAYSGVIRGTLNELTIVTTLSLTIVLVGAMTLQLAGGGNVALDSAQLQSSLEGHLWYAVLTLIGGEPILGMPQTELGLAVTLALMLGGMTVFGIFIGTVSASMVTVFTQRLQVSDLSLDELNDHVVVCGWNPAGPTMLTELFSDTSQRRAVVVLTENDDRPDDLLIPGLPVERIYHQAGDYTRVEVLESVGIRRASAAILLTDMMTPRSDQDRDARTVLAALTIERMAPGIFCCAELVNGQHESLLKMARVEEVVVRDWYAGVIIGSMGRNRGLSRVLNDILTTADGNAFHKVAVGRRHAGRTIGELHTLLKDQHGAILVSWERPGLGRDDTEGRVNPPTELVVAQDDVLVVISDHIIRLR